MRTTCSSRGSRRSTPAKAPSDAPLGGEAAKSAGWSTMAEYFDRLDKAGMPMNVAQTVGHTQVRRIVLGDTDRKATTEELEQMKALVREAMEAGAIGVSTALIYPPAVYAPTEEIVELARVAGTYGGGYYTHMRDEETGSWKRSTKRLRSASRRTPPSTSSTSRPPAGHHLAQDGAGHRPDQGRPRQRPARIAADIYPYVNNGLVITALIHPRHSADGREALKLQAGRPRRSDPDQARDRDRRGWENWYRHVGSDWDKIVLVQINAKPYARHNGETLAAIAKAEGQRPLGRLLRDRPGRRARPCPRA